MNLHKGGPEENLQKEIANINDHRQMENNQGQEHET